MKQDELMCLLRLSVPIKQLKDSEIVTQKAGIQ